MDTGSVDANGNPVVVKEETIPGRFLLAIGSKHRRYILKYIKADT